MTDRNKRITSLCGFVGFLFSNLAELAKCTNSIVTNNGADNKGVTEQGHIVVEIFFQCIDTTGIEEQIYSIVTGQGIVTNTTVNNIVKM